MKATGQVIFRKTDAKMEGKNVYILMSVIGLTDEQEKSIQNEHQYDLDSIAISNPKNVAGKTKGRDANGIFSLPIWTMPKEVK